MSKTPPVCPVEAKSQLRLHRYTVSLSAENRFDRRERESCSLELDKNGENIVSESDDSGSSSMQVEVFINLALQNNVLPSQVVEAIPHQMESLSLTWDFHAVCKKVLGLCRRYFLTTLT